MAEIEFKLSAADLQALAASIAEQLNAEAMKQQSPLLNEPEAAALLGCQRYVLRDARKRGELRFFKIGKFIRYDRAQLEEWKQRQSRQV